MNKKYENATCPECGEAISAKSYTLECDYCLSKKED
ncbi:MAG TPA: YhfH family protein [Pseudogracilibacillus sp.]|nr:YhfH family protein [Pseudogracilibacillus sp.]